MKMDVGLGLFMQQFSKEDWSYSGLEALYNHLTDEEEDRGEEMILLPGDVAQTWSEYESIEQLKTDYPFDGEVYEDVLEYLRDNTTVLEIDHSGHYVVASF